MEKLSDIFTITYGNGFELNRLSENKEGINFISRTSKNNGVSARIEMLIDVEPFKASLITVSLGGSVLEAFLQTSDFYTGYHIFCLRPKIELSEKQKLFYCLCIRANKYRYSYGRQANKTLSDILIPSISEIPVWVEKIQMPDIPSKKSVINKTFVLNTINWEYFRYDKLFTIERGKVIRIKDIISGHIPFVTSTDSNNGISAYVDSKPMHSGNTITVNRNGSVAEAFYQPKPFCSTEDVHVFNPKFKINKYVAFFLVTLIRMEKYRYSYGRKWGIERMRESLIKLPIDKIGNPDFEFMENYIKSLPFSISI